MSVIGSMPRLAGATLLVVAVAACGGVDRTNRGAAVIDGTNEGAVDSAAVKGLELELGAEVADTDDALAADLDGLLDGAGRVDRDVDLGLADLTAPDAASASAGSGASPAPAPLPTFDAGSFAELDAASSTLDQALGAGEPGSEGNLP